VRTADAAWRAGDRRRSVGDEYWTEATFGFGAGAIAVIDAAAASPFAQLSMIPWLR